VVGDQESRAFPKREDPINPINPRDELAMLAQLRNENRAYQAQFSSV
jgi:hypothetical protein